MCRVRHGISEEDMAKVMVLQMDDTPSMRLFFLCLCREKNVYRPEVGYELDRIKHTLGAAIQYDCKEDIIKECTEQYQTLAAEDFFFEIFKCIGENQHTHCKTEA